MTQLRRRVIDVNLWGLLGRAAFFRRFFRFLWDRVLLCSCGRPYGYRRLRRCSSSSTLPLTTTAPEIGPRPPCSTQLLDGGGDQDLVILKISLLGDCHIGKTSFMAKYVGDEEEERCLQLTGLNLMDKVFSVKGARIAYNIWDVGGDHQFLDHVPIACKDAAAILIMFDLTSRCTLNSAIGWYRQARKWNQTAIPVLIGTKFDDFVQLPLDIQWAIVSQVIRVSTSFFTQ